MAATMRAVVVREHGDLDKLLLEEREVPVPRADEVLVRVRAVALNHLDLWVRAGVPGHRFPLPLVPGCDAAGVVAAVGSAARGVQEGDEVVLAPGVSCGRCRACAAGRDHLCPEYGILGESRDGACAEYAVAPRENCLPKPANLGFEQAAAVPLVFLTAWHMLVARAELRAGETVLVQAAGSGVGSAAVQIAKMLGARVIATAGTAGKCALAKGLGADEAVDYAAADVAKEVKRLTSGQGCDVAIEHVGAATFQGSLRSLAKAGRLVTCGATTGAEVALNLRPVFFKGLSILGSTMGSRGELIEVLEHVAAGRLRPVVHRVLPLEEVREAHRLLGDRAAFGKVVLRP